MLPAGHDLRCGLDIRNVDLAELIDEIENAIELTCQLRLFFCRKLETGEPGNVLHVSFGNLHA
jgi:hypothetical protein